MGGDGKLQHPMEMFGFKSPSGDLKPNTGGLKADFKGGWWGSAASHENKIKIVNNTCIAQYRAKFLRKRTTSHVVTSMQQ